MGDRDVRRITKIQAARSHLRTACALWFADTDSVSVHTLAYAAHEVIHRIYRNQGHTDLLYDTTVIKDEFRSDFAKWLKKNANFFKHAERDSAATDAMDFDATTNEILLMSAIGGLQKMRYRLEVSESAFMFWLFLRHPNWFLEHPAKNRIPEQQAEDMRQLSKPEFFRAFLAARRTKSS